MKNPILSVILPVFNEEENISLISEKYSSLSKGVDFELIFVEDGGSTDNTRLEMKKAAKKYSFIKNLLIKERGYGISVYKGLESAKGEYICWTHADLQTDPADCFKALEIIKQQENPEICYIKGNRKGRPLFDKFFTGGMSLFESIILFKKMNDINAQPNLFHRSFLKLMENSPSDFSFDLYSYYLAKKNKYLIKRFPVLFIQRIHGHSAWNTGLKSKIKFIKRTIKFSIKMKQNIK